MLGFSTISFGESRLQSESSSGQGSQAASRSLSRAPSKSGLFFLYIFGSIIISEYFFVGLKAKEQAKEQANKGERLFLSSNNSSHSISQSSLQGSSSKSDKKEDAATLAYYPKKARRIIQAAQAHLQLYMSLSNPFLDEVEDANVYSESLQKAIDESAANGGTVEKGNFLKRFFHFFHSCLLDIQDTLMIIAQISLNT